jgi:hypothetical protein
MFITHRGSKAYQILISCNGQAFLTTVSSTFLRPFPFFIFMKVTFVFSRDGFAGQTLFGTH